MPREMRMNLPPLPDDPDGIYIPPTAPAPQTPQKKLKNKAKMRTARTLTPLELRKRADEEMLLKDVAPFKA